MSTDLTPTSTDYQTLVRDLQFLITEGQAAAQNAVNQIRINTYWYMGERIAQAQAVAGTDADLLTELSADLGTDKTLLYRITQFYRLWPKDIPTTADNALSWTHYVELLSVKDEEQRNFYLETAASENWDRNTLRKAIKKNYFALAQNPDTAATLLKRDPNPLHVYKAIVENVVDGDTMLVRIDLGFEVWVNQRIRFRGINTEEMTKRGKPMAASDRAERAKIFVQDKLKDIPFVVIKTYKTDLYGRYVADVFYHPTIAKKEDVATKGFFLNEEILKAELADVMIS